MFEIAAVTNRIQCLEPFEERLRKLRDAGLSAVILREKDLPDDAFLALARKAAAIFEGSGTRLVINGRTGAAEAAGIRDVQLSLAAFEKLCGEDPARPGSRSGSSFDPRFDSVGVSCHSLDDALKALRLGASYIILGNVFETGCKPGLPAKGLKLLEEVSRAVSIPVLAIGGIKKENVAAVKAAGAAGACVMGDFMTAVSPEELCAGLRDALRGNIPGNGGAPSGRAGTGFDKRRLALYGITDRRYFCGITMAEAVEKAISGGMTMLQLREKDLPADEFLKEALEIKKICERRGIPLIINDDLGVALKCGADGIHVGADDMSVSEIRMIAPPGFIIGATCKTVEQARKAEAEGADYMGVGAVFPSPTKQNAIRITPEELRAITSSVSIPAVAVGGVDIDNAELLRGSGISGCAVVSALFGAPDPEAAAAALRKKITEVVNVDRRY